MQVRAVHTRRGVGPYQMTFQVSRDAIGLEHVDDECDMRTTRQRARGNNGIRSIQFNETNFENNT